MYGVGGGEEGEEGVGSVGTDVGAHESMKGWAAAGWSVVGGRQYNWALTNDSCYLLSGYLPR